MKDPATQTALEVPMADPVPLRAGDLSAFGGFLSPTAMRVAFDVGKICAHNFLVGCELIALVPIAVPNTLLEQQKSAYDDEASETIHFLADRAAEVVQNNALFSLPFLGETAKHVIAGFVRNKVVGLTEALPTGQQYELRIYLPAEQFRLGGGSAGDVEPIKVPVDLAASRLALVTFGRHETDSNGNWYLGNLFGAGDQLQIRSPAVLHLPIFESTFCSCELPSGAATTEMHVQSHPIWSLTLDEHDKGTRITAARWKMEPAVQPVDTVFGAV